MSQFQLFDKIFRYNPFWQTETEDCGVSTFINMMQAVRFYLRELYNKYLEEKKFLRLKVILFPNINSFQFEIQSVQRVSISCLRPKKYDCFNFLK